LAEEKVLANSVGFTVEEGSNEVTVGFAGADQVKDTPFGLIGKEIATLLDGKG
jgi:hypothetical protein